jgi:hypothetical protein
MVNLNLPGISRLARRLLLFGLKVDKASLIGLAPWRVWVTYASGAIASMMFPAGIVLYAYLLGEVSEALLLGMLTIGNVFFTLRYSTRSGDFWRAKKAKSQLQSA